MEEHTPQKVVWFINALRQGGEAEREDFINILGSAPNIGVMRARNLMRGDRIYDVRDLLSIDGMGQKSVDGLLSCFDERSGLFARALPNWHREALLLLKSNAESLFWGLELLGEEVLSGDQREAVILATYSASELVEALKMAARPSAFQGCVPGNK